MTVRFLPRFWNILPDIYLIIGKKQIKIEFLNRVTFIRYKNENATNLSIFLLSNRWTKRRFSAEIKFQKKVPIKRVKLYVLALLSNPPRNPSFHVCVYIRITLYCYILIYYFSFKIREKKIYFVISKKQIKIKFLNCVTFIRYKNENATNLSIFLFF